MHCSLKKSVQFDQHVLQGQKRRESKGVAASDAASTAALGDFGDEAPHCIL